MKFAVIEDINQNISDLTSIKNNLNIFHKERYREEIKNITIIIRDIEGGNIDNFRDEKKQNAIP